MDEPVDGLSFTGERVVPGHVDPDLYQEHLSRYAFASALARGSRVLDAGCGTGYGTAALAVSATRVVGIDLAAEAVRYARDHYRVDGMPFVAAACEALPFPAGAFDVVVAFEVIEHLADPVPFLEEARRVLATGGLLVASTPNRRFSADVREVPNPFHVREYSSREFQALLAPFFTRVTLLGQSHMEGFLFQRPGAPEGAPCLFRTTLTPDVGGGELDDAQFFVAVCERPPAAFGVPPRLVYSGVRGNALLELRAAAAAQAAHLEGVIRERERHLAAQAAHLEGVIRERERHLAAQAAHLEGVIRERERHVSLLQAEVERLRSRGLRGLRQRVGAWLWGNRGRNAP